MLTIEYVPIDFPKSLGSELSEPNRLYFSWADLVRSAVTVGRKNWLHVVQHKKYSGFEIVYRAALLYANLKTTIVNHSPKTNAYHYLIQSSAYESLDPSEKSAISYFLALTASKLFAEKLLTVPWLMHLDTYRDQFDIKISPDYRPDLVGLNRNKRWVVIEAKGRSNTLNKQVMTKAKKQAMSLTKIAGRKPFLNIALASYFSSINNTLKIYAKDPPIENEGRFELDISLPNYVFAYYKPLMDFIRVDRGQTEAITTFQDRKYLIRRVNEADLWFGLDEQFYRLLPTTRSEELPTERLLTLSTELLQFQPEHSLERPHVEFSTGIDGTYVQLGNSWDDELMILEPQDRNTQ